MKMFCPPHPASILREDILPALGLSVTEAAKQLGISRVQLSRLLNEHSGISADMALRLEQWLQTPSAESWLKMQMAYDLWHVQQKARPTIQPAITAMA
ncbi:HigA family addiction module antitoxin [Thiomicrospira microaerophila]|uniref:HigA family addiction module antitoxin n=1 Tax=Thiomicrospira microaerophila TaxID=406020 RepID=UPI0005C901FA|nr:HigA family addiction module antitoxin [Thiomicrospira microaerophila]